MVSALGVSSPFLVGCIVGSVVANLLLDSGWSRRAVAVLGLAAAMIAICAAIYPVAFG